MADSGESPRPPHRRTAEQEFRDASQIRECGGGDLGWPRDVESVLEGDHRVSVDERSTRSDGISVEANGFAGASSGRGGHMDRLPVIVQRTESLAVAAFVLVLGVQLGFAWWWPIALFLAFDLSMVGYARSPRAGALVYDAVHSYVGPALFGAIGAIADQRWALLLSVAWAFHVAGDRAIGY